jgi:hypothetical protein
MQVLGRSTKLQMGDVSREGVQPVENVCRIWGRSAECAKVSLADVTMSSQRHHAAFFAVAIHLTCSHSQTIVAFLVSDSEIRKSMRSDRTRTSRSTVTWRFQSQHKQTEEPGPTHFVEEQHTPFSHESHTKLHPSSFTVGDLSVVSAHDEPRFPIPSETPHPRVILPTWCMCLHGPVRQPVPPSQSTAYSPIKINIQDAQQPVSPLLVPVSPNRVEKL